MQAVDRSEPPFLDPEGLGPCSIERKSGVSARKPRHAEMQSPASQPSLPRCFDRNHFSRLSLWSRAFFFFCFSISASLRWGSEVCASICSVILLVAASLFMEDAWGCFGRFAFSFSTSARVRTRGRPGFLSLCLSLSLSLMPVPVVVSVPDAFSGTLAVSLDLGPHESWYLCPGSSQVCPVPCSISLGFKLLCFSLTFARYSLLRSVPAVPGELHRQAWPPFCDHSQLFFFTRDQSPRHDYSFIEPGLMALVPCQ